MSHRKTDNAIGLPVANIVGVHVRYEFRYRPLLHQFVVYNEFWVVFVILEIFVKLSSVGFYSGTTGPIELRFFLIEAHHRDLQDRPNCNS